MAKTPAVESSSGDAPSVEILVPGKSDAEKAVDKASTDAKAALDDKTLEVMNVIDDTSKGVKKSIDETAAGVKKVIESATTGTKNVVSSTTSAATKTAHVVSEEFEVASGELANQVKTWVAEGNVRRLIVSTPDNKVVLEVPAMAGAVVGGLLILLAPILAAIGVIASIMSRVKVEVVRTETPAPKAQ